MRFFRLFLWPFTVGTAAVLVGVSVVQYSVAASSPVRKAATVPLALPVQTKVLVVAPHPDDEVLAAGDLIQRTLSSGGRVRVVYLTNGDAYVTAARRTFDKLFLGPQDFRSLGLLRQREALAALEVLGLSPGDAVFLGFPDKGLARIWLDHWNRPYLSLATAASAVPYPGALQPGVPYSGREFVALIRQTLRDFQPDIIVIPGLMDLHPDHQAAAFFTRAAWSEERRTGALAGSTLLEYVVHREAWHLEHGAGDLRLLTRDPEAISRRGYWLRLDPTPTERARKRQAIRAYQSQVKVMPGFLYPFASRPELFRLSGGRLGLRLRGA